MVYGKSSIYGKKYGILNGTTEGYILLDGDSTNFPAVKTFGISFFNYGEIYSKRELPTNKATIPRTGTSIISESRNDYIYAYLK